MVWLLPYKKPAPSKAYYSEAMGDHAVHFIENFCTHPVGRYAGQPLKLLPWQISYTKMLFGWRLKKDNTRLFKRVLITMARKNGKTVLSLCWLLYSFLVEQIEQLPQFHIVSTDRENAQIPFNQLATMIDARDELSEKLIVLDTKIYVADKPTAIIKTLTKKPKFGASPSCILFDELHDWDFKKGEALEAAEVTGTIERPNPLMIYCSTVGEGRESSFFNGQFSYGEDVLSGKIKDEEYLPIMFFVPTGSDADIAKVSTWKQANPSYGSAVFNDGLKRALKKYSNSNIDMFRLYHLNQWIEHKLAWLDVALWKRLGFKNYPSIAFTKEYKNRRCWAGLDLSQVSDLTSCCFVFEPTEEYSQADVVWLNWLPRSSLAHNKYGDIYKKAHDNGFLILQESPVIDTNACVTDIMEFVEDCEIDLQDIACDQWRIKPLVPLFDEKGIDLIGVPQAFSFFDPAIRELEADIKLKKLRHCNDPLAALAFSSVRLVRDQNGNQKPDKSDKDLKIDPVVTLLMAYHRMKLEYSVNHSIFGDQKIW